MRKVEGNKIGKDGDYPEMMSRKGDVVYPSIYFDLKTLPEAKDWEIGQTYDVTVRIRMTGLNVRKNEGQKKDYGDSNFEVVGIEPKGKVKSGKKARYTADDEDGDE